MAMVVEQEAIEAEKIVVRAEKVGRTGLMEDMLFARTLTKMALPMLRLSCFLSTPYDLMRRQTGQGPWMPTTELPIASGCARLASRWQQSWPPP